MAREECLVESIYWTSNHISDFSVPLFLSDFVLTVKSEIFDEHQLIATLVVNQIIHQLVGQQDAESAGAEPFLVANGDMAERIGGRIIDGSVFELAGIEAFAGVFDPV